MGASLFTNGWHTLNAFIQACWIVAVVSSLLLAILVIIYLFDLDTTSGPHSEKQHIIPRIVLSFSSVFSWMMLLMLYAGVTLELSLLFSVLTGMVAVFLSKSFSRRMMHLSYNYKALNQEKLLGLSGFTQSQIPAHRSGFGKVRISYKGSAYEMEAMTPGDTLPAGTTIKVIDVVEKHTLIVEKADLPSFIN